MVTEGISGSRRPMLYVPWRERHTNHQPEAAALPSVFHL